MPINGGVVGVGFVGFINQFGCDGAPFFGSVAVSRHEPEQEVEEVVCHFW